MRHDKLERELHLILLLAENHQYSINELCDKVGISRRNFYYYLEFLRDCGFRVYKNGNTYGIDRDSPFFNHLMSRISFTEEEAVQIGRLLDKAELGNPLVANIKKKLERFYDFNILADEDLREQAAHNIRSLYDAIKMKRQVVLHGYTSPHSQTTRDRFVEPFLLMNNNNEVRCYEPASGLNKTFKVSRMQNVEILDTEWEYVKYHRQVFTDVFMFSGEVLLPVELYLGQLSYNVLKEEYPQAGKMVEITTDGRRHLRMDVCNYAGIGRFVLGLFDDVEIVGGVGFVEYIRRKIASMSARLL